MVEDYPHAIHILKQANFSDFYQEWITLILLLIFDYM